MQHRRSLGYCRLLFIMLLIHSIYSSTLTNLCSDIPSCNCTLTNSTDLSIVCHSTPALTELPTLSPSTLQTNVKKFNLISSTTLTKGPLTSLPTNICSYPNISTLDLSSNNINGSLNTSALACLGSNLNHVDFSKNNINDIDLNFFEANRKLQTIDLSQNNLKTMPPINAAYFVNFPSTITLINLSFNQITSVDFWPLFVKTRNTMTIDMSNNLVQNYTNIIPITLVQLTETPDPRKFDLKNNLLTRFSDTLLEQYGACTAKNTTSTAYFVVGITNVLLTNNSLICDCESYNLITYINDGINDFPDISNGNASITQATCAEPSSMVGRKYISTNFSEFNNCQNYTLPNITDIFCSVQANDSKVTLPTPTYWPSTTTLTTAKQYDTNQTRGVNTGGSSTSWFIILGVVLGLATILGVTITIAYVNKHKIYLNGLGNRGQRIRMNKLNSNPNPNLAQTHPLDTSQAVDNNYAQYTLYDEPVLYITAPATDAATNTANIVKGIPLSGAQPKMPSIFANAMKSATNNDAQLNIAPISLTPSRRAKLLPQIKNAVYTDSSHTNLLNTSASTSDSKHKLRAQSSIRLTRPNQKMISPLPPRPHSMRPQKKTLYDSSETFDGNNQSNTTTASPQNKSSKSSRTAPTLNISFAPSWVNSSDEQL